MTPILDELDRLAKEATPGPWYHCQPFMKVPTQSTIFGPVPTARVDYVSTHKGIGTPEGHKVIIPMADRPCSVTSENMAYIAALDPQTVLALIAHCRVLEEALDMSLRVFDELDTVTWNGDGCPVKYQEAQRVSIAAISAKAAA